MKKGQVRLLIIILLAVVILIMAGCSVRIGSITFTVQVHNRTDVHVWFITDIPGAMAYLVAAGELREFPNIPKGTQVEFQDPASNQIWIEGVGAFVITIHQDYTGLSNFQVEGAGTPADPYRIWIGPPPI